MNKLWLIAFWLMVATGLNSCSSSMGEDCMGGAGNCTDENVKDLSFMDTNYIPAFIRQQMVFVSNVGTNMVVYSDGIIYGAVTCVVGKKLQQGRCGTEQCSYYVKYPIQKLKYSDSLSQEVFTVNRFFLINTLGAYNYGKYLYTSKEYSNISILGTNFYFPSMDFNAKDSNSIDSFPVITIGSNSYKNVLRFTIDSNKVAQSMPYECYYSKDNSGLLAFTLKGGVQYLRID